MRVDWILLESGEPAAIQVGDVVSAEAGGLPTYRVMAIEDGRAWLKDETRGLDCISPVSRFHWKACVASD
jgi:hypothetical protein